MLSGGPHSGGGMSGGHMGGGPLIPTESSKLDNRQEEVSDSSIFFLVKFHCQEDSIKSEVGFMMFFII